MRYILLTLCGFLAGCAATTAPPPPPAVSSLPNVRVEGVDGTVFHGRLLNGTVTIDSGQGQFTLQTEHVRSINLAAQFDTVDSPSAKLSGKVRDEYFQLRNEHGVFTLLKERLRRIDFVDMGPAPTTEPAARLARDD